MLSTGVYIYELYIKCGALKCILRMRGAENLSLVTTPLPWAQHQPQIMWWNLGYDVLDRFDVHGATSLINSGEHLEVIGSGIKSGATPVAAFLQEWNIRQFCISINLNICDEVLRMILGATPLLEVIWSGIKSGAVAFLQEWNIRQFCGPTLMNKPSWPTNQPILLAIASYLLNLDINAPDLGHQVNQIDPSFYLSW